MNYFRKKRFWILLILFAPIIAYAGKSFINRYFPSVPCLTLKQVTQKTTPETLFPSGLQCFRENKIDEGIALFIIAKIFAVYDSYRVDDERLADKIREQLIEESIESLSFFQTWDYDDAMLDTVNDYAGGLPKLYRICRHIDRIGMPTYYPAYALSEDNRKAGAPYGLTPGAPPDRKKGVMYMHYCKKIDDLFGETTS